MNTRERFLETMLNFNTGVPAMKWEFGYWGETINNWYKQGLPKINPPKIPDTYTTISASVYTKSWLSKNIYVNDGELPNGYPVMGGGLYYPTQGFALDSDVREYFNMDKTQMLVDANLFFYPMFEPKTLEETDDMLKYLDIDGVVRVYLKKSSTMASGWEWPLKDRRSWEILKDERVNFKNIKDRLPANWKVLVEEYKNRDYPLGLGGYPLGFFGTLVHLMGYERLFFMYYDDPKLVHDIIDTITNIWIAVFEEILDDVEIDHMQIWEDISFGKGCMLSDEIMREFMLPYYKRMTDFLKGHGVNLIFVDTDGDCIKIIPFFIEAGVTGLFPFEANCGMDIVKVRNEFPNLAMMGGVPKSDLNKGKAHVDKLLTAVEYVLKTGGYIPYADHFIPPDISFADFTYYRSKLNNIIDTVAKETA